MKKKIFFILPILYCNLTVQAQTSSKNYLLEKQMLDVSDNQIQGISDNAGSLLYDGSFDFKDGASESTEYLYNANGALTKDLNKGISKIEYDVLDNLSCIIFNNGFKTKYVYDAGGSKLRTIHAALTTNTTDYIGDFRFEDGRLSKYQFEGGYCSFDSNLAPTYHYYEKDHLGSICMVVNENGTIEQVNHYYPFGGVYGDLTYNSELQRNKYIGEEFDHTSGLDWYDHGARMYDAAKGSWDRVDKLAEKCSEVNPYCYCLLNPILKTDLDGNAPGDFFVTMDEVAIDFGLFYNAQSIKENKEYGSTIYEIWDVKKGKGYSYSSANTGRAKNSVLCNMPHNYHRITADIHTHGAYSYDQYNDNTFSGLRGNNNQLISTRDRKKIKNNYDIGLANKHKRISYVVTPNGSLQKYDPQTGKIKVLSNDMPSDSNDPDRLNENNVNYISIGKTIVQKTNIINFLYH